MPAPMARLALVLLCALAATSLTGCGDTAVSLDDVGEAAPPPSPAPGTGDGAGDGAGDGNADGDSDDGAGGDDPADPVGGDEPDPPAANALIQVLAEPLGMPRECPSLALSATAADTGSTIRFTGVPATLGEPGIRVIAGDDVTTSFVRADSPAGTAVFVVPPHPGGLADGGPVTVEIGDGVVACAPVALTINALPAAPADYAVTVQAALEAYVDESLQLSGYDPSALLTADTDTLSPGATTFWLVKQFVSANRAGSLARNARAAANNPDDFAERVLMASGIEAAISDARNRQANRPGATLADASKRAHIDRQTLRKQAACDAQAFDADALRINSAAELAAQMRAAGDLGLLSRAAGPAATLSGSVGLAASGAAADTASVAGGVLYAATTLDQAQQALLPRDFTSYDVASAETLWVEDRPASQPARWDTATVNAKGVDFNVSEAILNGLVTVIGAVPGPVGTAVSTAGVVAPDAVSATVRELTADSCIRIRAPNYGPINVSSEPYTESRIEGGSVEKLTHRTYRGVDIGGSDLIVELQTGQFGVSEFGSAISFEKRFNIVVQPLAISRIPSVRTVEPGEVVELSVTAPNAFTDPADFDNAEVLGGNTFGAVVNQQADGDFYTARVQTVMDREKYPVFVRFTSGHDRLPEGTEPYRPVIELRLDGNLDIEPDTGCLLPGQSFDLTVEISGLADDERDIEWTASAGSFTDPAAEMTTFIAPQAAGDVTITVTAVADPSVTDSITLPVSTQCIRKVWYPNAAIAMDGNGVYSPGDPCPMDTAGDRREELLETEEANMPEPPPIPPNDLLWFDRSASVDARFNHNSTRHAVVDNGTDDPADDSCTSASLTGEAMGDVAYAATADGTLTASVSADLSGQCEELPADDGETEVVCANSAITGGLFGYYFAEIDAESTFRVTGALSCANLGGNIQMLPLQMIVTRFVGGTEPYEPPSQGVTGVRDEAGNYRSPQLFSVRCTNPDEMVPIDVTFTLDAPPPNTTDLIAFPITGSVLGQINGVEREDFGPPAPPMIGPGGVPTNLPMPEAGMFRTTVNIGVELLLEQQ